MCFGWAYNEGAKMDCHYCGTELEPVPCEGHGYYEFACPECHAAFGSDYTGASWEWHGPMEQENAQ